MENKKGKQPEMRALSCVRTRRPVGSMSVQFGGTVWRYSRRAHAKDAPSFRFGPELFNSLKELE
ncbi:MAG TPA: hypothetical protein VJY36_01065 [Candidatus Bathyarchaeia archaeon]|nr:hypothetical protein [Candidatus Bathyarchaeia archaeon]